MPELFDGAEKKTRPASVTILKPQQEVFALFHNFSYLPRAMPELDRIEDLGNGVHRWFAKGEEAAWDTELVLDEAPDRIAWRARDEGVMSMVGAFTFEPALGGRATIVSLKLYFPSAMGRLVGLARKLKGEDPDTQAATALRRLKALLETGEIATTEGQPTGRDEAVAA
jgi:uncharacterized membrane protein